MGKSAPAPDPAIGQAALLSAQTGADYYATMQQQAALANQWAAEDRARYQNTFIPLQDAYIQQAQDWANPANMQKRVNESEAATRNAIAQQQAAAQRQQAAMGVAPNSGRSAALARTNANAAALAVAGAGNTARNNVRNEAQAMQINAINMGSGLPMQAMSNMNSANQSYSSGATGALNGYGQQGQLLNTQYQQQMAYYDAQNQAASDLFGGFGSILGLAYGSDKNIKEGRKKVGRSLLDAVNKMPVEEWSYKPGEGDGGRHIGTYAQDFKKQTGMGDGKTINVIDAIGTAMGAIKELSAKVDALSEGRSIKGDETAAHEMAESRKVEAAEKKAEAQGKPEADEKKRNVVVPMRSRSVIGGRSQVAA
jgi:hypothetical protein